MKRAILHLVSAVLALAPFTSHALEPIWRYAVEASATVYPATPKIALSWVADPYAVSYTVSRRALSDRSWKTVASLPGTATSYEDATVAVHQVYEYQIQKSGQQEVAYTGYGYVRTAIDAPLVDNRGGLLLVVDNTYAADLAPELARLQQDLAGDGWTVTRADVNRTDSVPTVKNVVKSWYNATSNAKALFLFGHVAVPYSGTAAPDGHPSHQAPGPRTSITAASTASGPITP